MKNKRLQNDWTIAVLIFIPPFIHAGLLNVFVNDESKVFWPYASVEYLSHTFQCLFVKSYTDEGVGKWCLVFYNFKNIIYIQEHITN